MEDKKKELLQEFDQYCADHNLSMMRGHLKFLELAFDRMSQSKDQEWKEKVKGITPELPDELGTIVDDYDDYVTGFQDAKIALLLEKAVTSSTKKD